MYQDMWHMSDKYKNKEISYLYVAHKEVTWKNKHKNRKRLKCMSQE